MLTESKENETLSHYRVISFLIIALSMISVSSFYCFIGQKHFDTWICIYIVDLVFFLSFVFLLEYERKRARIAENYESTLLRISIGFIIDSLLCIGFYWIPTYFRPVILFAIVLYAVGNSVIALSMGFYFCVLICLLTASGSFELALYVTLLGMGISWIRVLEEKAFHLYSCLTLALISFLLPQIFNYLELHLLSTVGILYSAINAIIIFFLCYFLYRQIRQNTIEEVHNRMIDILSNAYSEVLELKSYSNLEYNHAVLVSDLCGKYAKLLGLNEDLAAAGGFYYRLGKWKGEPHVENGVFFAKKLCFPAELIVLLSEYYGEQALPSTKESALVHIVDATIKKLKVLQEEASASGWNKELLIYQTLNEYSQSGIYDESGLTMNQFLTIRELLVKEEKLSEFLS